MVSQPTVLSCPEDAGDLSVEVLNNLTTGVLLFDASLRLTEMNQSAEAALKVSFASIKGEELDVILPGLPALRAAVKRVLATGEGITERELALDTDTAEPVLADCWITPWINPDLPCGVLIELVLQDRRRRMTREAQLLTQNESFQTVVRGLAHEVKNPLGGLRGAAQLLQAELSDPELVEYTQVIIGEADRLQALVDRMLTPAAVPRPTLLNVHQVTERVRTLIHAEAPVGITVNRDYDPSIPDIRIDPDLLIQAVLNVARNAVQAMDANGELMIRTRVERNLNIGAKQYRLGVRIDLCDDGPGIPPELLDRVFHPLVSGSSSGTGLGLSIAQSLVTQQGGLIECTSQPGNTIFSVLLPVGEPI